jgi:hypothetical protein
MRCVLSVVSLIFFASGCKKDRAYESRVEITRIDAVRLRDGKARDLDVEFSYPDCPGKPVEVIRGGADFAQCLSRYKVGDTVPVKVRHHWDAAGFYDWDIYEMGGCSRPPDPDDEASFDEVKECEPIVVNGVEEGFHCSYVPQKMLLSKCPWFRRH